MIVPKEDLEEIKAMIKSEEECQYILLINDESAGELEIESHEDKQSWLHALRERGASHIAYLTADIPLVTKEAQLACLEDMLKGRVRACSPYADALY